MFGKKLDEYYAFERWILILIAAVFATRLGLSLGGVSTEATRWVSINIALLVGLIYCSVAVHTKGFGSYKQLFGLLLVQTTTAHVLIIIGIILGIAGIDNVYTAPEFFGGSNGANWLHVLAHATVGIVVHPAVLWLLGSAILFATKKLAGTRGLTPRPPA